MIRKLVPLLLVGLCIGVSAAFVLGDEEKVTTSSREAYEAYLEGLRNLNKLYYVDAHKSFMQAVEEDPEFAMAYMRLSALAAGSGRKCERGKYIEKAMSLRGHVSEKERLLIEYENAKHQGEIVEAERLFGELAEEYPRDTDVLKMRGLQAAGKNNMTEAIQLFENLIEVDPNYALGYNQLGYWYAFEGEYEKGLSYLRKYAFVVPDQANPHDSLGELYLWLGRYSDAEREFTKALEIKPDFFYSRRNLAFVYHARGQDARATELLGKMRYSAQSGMEGYTATLALSSIYRDMGEPEKAVDAIWSFVDSYPWEPWLLMELGAGYAQAGLFDAADAAAESLRVAFVKKTQSEACCSEKSPEDFSSYLYLVGTIAREKGETREALRALTKAFEKELCPGWGVFLQREVAGVHLKNGSPLQAEVVLKKALKTNPNEARCLLMIAQAYDQLGNSTKAREFAARFMEVMKDADPGHEIVREAEKILAEAS
jgi:tetratricopeptide (TPR) repeat protein